MSEQSQLCLSSDSNGATVAQFETLEGWTAARNASALEAALAKDRAAHDATMGEDPIFTQTDLMGAWSLMEQATSEIIGVLASAGISPATITSTVSEGCLVSLSTAE